jgi:hypothetical protein
MGPGRSSSINRHHHFQAAPASFDKSNYPQTLAAALAAPAAKPSRLGSDSRKQ